MYEPELEPTTNFLDVDYGLITPTGLLFETEFEGHCGLAEDLFDAGLVSSNSGKDYYGCVHLADGDFDVISGAGWYSRQRSDESRRVTQKQFDTMVAYKTARGETFPWNILEVIDAEKPKTRATRKAKSNPFSQVALAS